MAQVIIPQRWKARRGTAAALTTANEVLLAGELCFETDTGKFKIGDGSTAWNSLAYQGVWTLADVRRALDLLGSTAAGDIIYKGASGWTRLAKGTDGQVLTLASGIPSWAAGGGGGGGGAMTLISTTTVSGSAASSISVTGLDLATDGAYLIVACFKNALTSSMAVRMYYNADTTNANYQRQTGIFNGAGSAAARANDAGIFEFDSGNSTLAHILISRDPDGRPLATSESCRNPGSNIYAQKFTHFRNNTANVTEIALTPATANAIAIGSYLRLYKVTA